MMNDVVANAAGITFRPHLQKHFGHFLLDIDECLNPDNCQYGDCRNRDGSYVCQCPRYYELNPSGTGCIGTN